MVVAQLVERLLPIPEVRGSNPSCIPCWDSNSRPLEHESPPITTRPGISDVVTSGYGQKTDYIMKAHILLSEVRVHEYCDPLTSTKGGTMS